MKEIAAIILCLEYNALMIETTSTLENRIEYQIKFTNKIKGVALMTFHMTDHIQ